MTAPTPPPKAPDPWDSTKSKGSEKYLDFVKAESERMLAKSRVIDERARGNAALAAAAIAIIGLLKPPTINIYYVAMIVLASICVLVLLILTAEIVKNRDASVNTETWFKDTAELLYYEELPYAKLLNQLQFSWIRLLFEQREVNKHRFILLHQQRLLLITLFGIVGVIVVISLLTPAPLPPPAVAPALHSPLIGPALPVK